jgi:dolichyl-phosphate beta-glucosyltransferase
VVAALSAAIDSGSDIAIGSREVAGAEVRTPARRRLMRRALNMATRAATGLRVRDTQCGLKLLSTRDAGRLLERQLAEGYAFDVELLMRAANAGLSVAEVPVAYAHGDGSRVDVPRAAPRMVFDVVRLAFHLRGRPLAGR